MEDWPENLVDIIDTIVGAAIVIIGIFIQRKFTNNDKIESEYDAYKHYSKPLIKAAQSLGYRLKEILEFNGNYLLPNAPESGFFKYKFDSTVFRLCALIGWIRALEIEYSYIEGWKESSNKKIRNAINDFKAALADGGHLEVSIVNDLSKLFRLETDFESLSDKQKATLGAKIEVTIFNNINDRAGNTLSNLAEYHRVGLVKDVLDTICENLDCPKVSDEFIKANIDDAITELNREYCWIYRDWQDAIGDCMISRDPVGNRLYSIIGYAKFKEMSPDNQYIRKAMDLFSDLDVTIDNKYDVRIAQIKRIAISTISILEELNHQIAHESAVAKESLKELTEFKKTLKGNLE